ncbi:MAG: DNA-directed RNA polymerase subunit omega [Bacteroidetes bacterium]|jgi:DNA-directed RNA polymerase subunit K/omega|nr:DNA-directed RNA polymerase subunit omega [Bacteroidota bacterium]
MNFKNVKAERTTITRNTKDIEDQGTGNIFESIVILSKRSNQLSSDLKKELAEKMDEFVIPNDSLEEVFENREQIEISKFYERLPKPHSIAVKELEDGQIYFTHKEKEEDLTFVAAETTPAIEAKSSDASEVKGELVEGLVEGLVGKSEKKANDKTEA